MRKQDQLLLLIKSLTPAEKKYFVQSAKADGQTKSYLQLYEALLKADTYNADELSRQLKKKKADLANEKKYLEYLLLKSLRSFFEKHSDVGLYNALSWVAILCDKRLYTQSLNIIEKAKPGAIKRNNFTLYAELCFQQASILQTLRGSTTQRGRDKIGQLKQEGLNALEQTKQWCELENIQAEATGLMERFNFLNAGDVTRAVDKMLKLPALSLAYDNLRLKTTQNETLALLYRLKRDFVKSVSYLEANLAISEKFPVESELSEHHYFWQLNNIFQTYLQLKAFDKAGQQIDYLASKKYHRLGLKNHELDKKFAPALVERKLLLNLSRYLQKKATRDDLLKVLGEFECEGESNLKDWSANEQMVTLLAAARLYLLTAQPDKAITYTTFIINHTDFEFRPPLHAGARLVAIMAHYELGSIRILKSLIQSARRFSQNNKLLTEVDSTTFLYLLQLASPKSSQEQINILSQLHKAYRTFEKNPALKEALPIVTVSEWAERNIEKLKNR